MNPTLLICALALALAAPRVALTASSNIYANPPLMLAGGKPKKQKKLPYGQQKRLDSGKGLSRGWRKKLAAGEVLSESDYRRSTPIAPAEAPRYPVNPGEELIQLEGKIVRLMKNTREIIQVLDTF